MNTTRHRAGVARPVSAERPKLEFVCAYDYADEYGQVLFQKVRYRTEGGRGKTFRYRWQPDGRALWRPGKPPGADAYPYRLPELLRAIRNGRRRVWIVAGEKDVDALRDAGAVATTMHQGEEVGPDSEQCQWFTGFGGRALVVADDDPAGYYCAKLWWIGLTKYAGLGSDQVRFRLAREGNDAADHLAAGYGLGDFRRVSRKTVWEKAGQHRDELAARRGGYWYPRNGA